MVARAEDTTKLGGARSVATRILKGLDRSSREAFQLDVLRPPMARKTVIPSPRETTLSNSDLDDLLDYLCSVARRQKIFYLWRPRLRDPRDELVLELAVAAHCRTIVTFNKRDFVPADRFDIEILDPAEFLHKIGESSWEP